MSLANYSDLQSAVADWLFRTGDADLAARAPDCIALFEADFLSDPDMRTAEMEEVDTTPIAGAIISLPSGFIDMIRIQVLGGVNAAQQRLDYVTPYEAEKLDATVATSGVCKWYTVLAGQLYLAPQQWAPVGATLEMAYYSFAPLSAINTTNWLFTKYPNLYLAGSLMHAAAYVDDKETAAQWKVVRDETMAKIAKSERKRKIGAAPLIVRPSAGFIR